MATRAESNNPVSPAVSDHEMPSNIAHDLAVSALFWSAEHKKEDLKFDYALPREVSLITGLYTAQQSV